MIYLWFLVGPVYALIFSGMSFIVIFLLAIGSKTGQFFMHFLLMLINIILLLYFYNKFTARKNRILLGFEHLEEKKNTILNRYHKKSEISKALDKKMYRYSTLNSFIEILSSSLDLHELANHIVKKTISIIEKSDVCILYNVDEIKLQLSLLASRSNKDKVQIKEKEGDIFDQWVFRHRQPVNIYDIQKDFRFSAKDIENISRDVRSIISVPLITKNRIVGTLRLDSHQVGAYNPDDLRLLDIISDLAAVGLENALLYKRIETLAIKDDLTDLYVRRYFKESFIREFSQASKYKKPLNILILDIDHFKQYNDTYGHTAGDIVLKEVADILSQGIEKKEGKNVIARFGGEEFIVLLPEINKSDAIKKAEKIRKKIQNNSVILRRKKTSVTVSVGVANYPEDSKLKSELIHKADINLYKAKTEGRNKICY